MGERAARRIGIVDDQDEALRFAGNVREVERRRAIFVVAAEPVGNQILVAERG